MLPALASEDAFITRIPGGVPEADLDRARAALEDASSKVRAVARKDYLNDAGDDVIDVPDVVVTVTLALAKRLFDNPDGRKSSREEIDGYSDAWTLADHALAGPELTPAEEDLVRGAVGRRRSGSARLGRPRTLPTSALVTANNRAPRPAPGDSGFR